MTFTRKTDDLAVLVIGLFKYKKNSAGVPDAELSLCEESKNKLYERKIVVIYIYTHIYDYL